MSYTKNKANVLGHIGSEIDVRRFEDGGFSVQFRVATNHYWFEGQDESRVKHEETEWHQIKATGKHGKNLAKLVEKGSLKKGSYVDIEGRLKTHKWTDTSGVDRYTTQVVVEKFGLLK
ncbi:single-stranded DNA-binding protein [Vibrio europaeus]|uniref:single-stranded DNA-binding protein n=1 Tax=Vibrio europaeus TaxID=300876 RepID=UPI00233ED8D2|nr:single-stranded DNA-binding protein [Vibrio europaeus]MDC5870258.1 single-stranded DNA-binding protein [Vibrio europaeus]